MTALSARLRDLRACSPAVEWVESFGNITAQDAWDRCERGDWMLWLIGRVAAGEPWSDQRRPLVLAAARCAELAPPIYSEAHLDDERPAKAVRLAIAWGSGGDVPPDDMIAAAADAAYAAYAAAYAAYAAYAAAYAAYAAAYDAYAAYAAAYAAYAAAADRSATLRRCAEIVREVFPMVPEGLGGENDA